MEALNEFMERYDIYVDMVLMWLYIVPGYAIWMWGRIRKRETARRFLDDHKLK